MQRSYLKLMLLLLLLICFRGDAAASTAQFGLPQPAYMSLIRNPLERFAADVCAVLPPRATHHAHAHHTLTLVFRSLGIFSFCLTQASLGVVTRKLPSSHRALGTRLSTAASLLSDKSAAQSVGTRVGMSTP